MPFTFFAHQLPVLPLARYTRERFDGLALVTGSLAPDLAYAFWFTQLQFDSHQLLSLLWWSMPVAATVAVLTRGYLIGPISLAMPNCGPFNLRDYSKIASRNPNLIVTLYSAILGALTHVVLDSFTHSSGFMVQHWSLLSQQVTLLGSSTPLFHALQYGGHIFFSIASVCLLAIYGRQRWMLSKNRAVNSSSASIINDRLPLPKPIKIALIVGIIISVALAAATTDQGWITNLFRTAWIIWLALLAGALISNNERAKP